MQPNQPQDPSRYDFFLNPPSAPKQSKLPSVPGLPKVQDPFLKRVVILAGGGIVLIIVIIILAKVIFGGGGNSTSLVSLAQQQNELVRVATEGTTSATQQTTKNLAINAELGLTTSQQQLLTYLSQHGQKVGTKQLALTKNASTDSQLTAATAASNFDPIFTQIMEQELQTYNQSVKQSYGQATNTQLKQLLSDEYNAGTLLLTQAQNNAKALQGQ